MTFHQHEVDLRKVRDPSDPRLRLKMGNTWYPQNPFTLTFSIHMAIKKRGLAKS
jgi:hypothetical protein